MQGLYILSDVRVQEVIGSNSIGILKKVFNQIAVLNKEVCPTNSINFNYRGNTKITRLIWRHLSRRSLLPISEVPADLRTKKNCQGIDFAKIDFVYIRFFFPTRLGFLSLLKNMKKNKPTLKILLEIPTYPYDSEQKTIRERARLVSDKVYRKKLKNYVDRIVTPGNFEEIFGCPVLQITNGTDVASIPVVEPTEIDKTHIHVIAVAQFAFWHGYERFIEGMGEYYKKYGDKIGTEEFPNITLHLVGDGTEIPKYKALVDKFCLETQGLFHGTLASEELTNVFNESNLALCSLGSHRAGIYGSSSMLKSREYLSRGLPLVSSTKIDVIPNDFPYAYYVSEDEKPVDVHAVAKWWNNLHSGKKRENIVKDIRQFAEENCTMEKAMKNVTDYLNNEILNNSIDMRGGASDFSRNPKRR